MCVTAMCAAQSLALYGSQATRCYSFCIIIQLCDVIGRSPELGTCDQVIWIFYFLLMTQGVC